MPAHTPASMTRIEAPWQSQAGPWTWQRDMEAMLGSAPRVLLAEDDIEMRALVCAGLRRDGYEVIEARNGVELASLVRSEVLQPALGVPVDILITDVVMPGRTGLDVLTWLRSHDWTTPVVLVTAFGTAELHGEARRLGAAVLDKPFELAELRRLVRALERR